LPELCNAGASTDFADYNKALSLAQAQAAIGTPDKSRWTQIHTQSNYVDKTLNLAPGIYRADSYYNSDNYTSLVFTLSTATNARVLTNNTWGPTADCNGKMHYNETDVYTGERTINITAFGPADVQGCTGNSGRVMRTPGITVDDMNKTAKSTTVYKLN
jgi:hypothetical protein